MSMTKSKSMTMTIDQVHDHDHDHDLYEDLLAAVGVPHTGRHVLVVRVARQLVEQLDHLGGKQIGLVDSLVRTFTGAC